MTPQDSPEARIAKRLEEWRGYKNAWSRAYVADVTYLSRRLHEQAQEIERLKAENSANALELIGAVARKERAMRDETAQRERAEAAESALAAARMALERTTAMCRAATTWAPDDTQGLRYHALEAAKDGMAALAELTQGHTSPGRDTA